MFFGERLEYLRNENHLTQKQLGSKLNLSGAVISSYERGISYPNIKQLKSICDFFDVTPLYLLCYTNIPLPIHSKNNIETRLLSDTNIDENMLNEIYNYIDYLCYKKDKEKI